MFKKTCMILALAAMPLALAPATAQAETRHGLAVSDHGGTRHYRGDRDHHGAKREHRRHAGHRDGLSTRIYIGSSGRHGYRDHRYGHGRHALHHHGHRHYGKGHHGKRHYGKRHYVKRHHGHRYFSRPYAGVRGWGLIILD